jgi:serine/threonine protein kinase/tetratricopeptide (TPR) repeat protein
LINFRFEIIKQIGKGRSEVYLCRDMDFNGKEVAVKFLSPDVNEDELKSFRDEYFTLGKLDHPNIINAFEIGEVVTIDQNDPVQIGSMFISLEYFESSELFNYEFLQEEEKLKEILKQICSVLYYLHQSNYIFYDLKPENILVSSASKSPEIKLIDLGLAEFSPNQNEHVIKGTAQYIAPELLKKESYDHQVDLYSLGIMLYEIIYGHLPFDASDEISIYKAQVEQEFTFPESKQFSMELIGIVKRLLEKDPQKRYQNTLPVIYDLGLEINASIYHDFVPAKVFSGRQDFINILTAYINDRNSSEVFSIKGSDGGGKTALLNRIYEEIPDSILITNTQGITGIGLIQYISKRMILSRSVFLNLNDEEKGQVLSFIKKSEKDFLDELHLIISMITDRSQFVVLVDDYNLFDSFAKEVISGLIPIFQVNGIKVIISEASDFDYASDNINNMRELLVGSFTEKQLSEYLELAFYNLFPKEKVKDLILRFADLLPANIIYFVRDLINLQVIFFDDKGVNINENVEKLSSLEGSLSGIYELRLSNLNPDELNTVKAISAFEGNVEQSTLTKLLNIDFEELNKIFSALQFNNIIQPFSANPVPVIVSDGLKKHIYSLIDNKEVFHAFLADSIATALPDFNKREFARQYELAADFENAYFVWNKEINAAMKLAAFSYVRSILAHLLEIPITETEKNLVNYRLMEILYKLSDFNSVLETIEQIEIESLTKDKVLELYIIKGSSMIGAGKLEEGMGLIESLIPQVEDEFRKSKLLVEIAYATFDLNNFDEAAEMCNEILERPKVSDEDRGRLHNLLGMCVIYQNQDSEDSLKEFFKSLEYYEKSNLTIKVAAIEVNIGNVYNLQGDTENAEIHWKKALDLNLSIGNLYQEAIILLNNGIYYFDKTEFEECIEYYKRAHKIFLSLGNSKNQGIALSNLGEVYLTTCEYQNAFEALDESKTIFEETNNLEELIPVFILLGYFYFTLGDYQKLGELHKSTLTLWEDTLVREKYKNELLLIKNLQLIATGGDVQISELEAIRDDYLEKEDFKNYVTVNTILLNYLIGLKSFSSAEEELKKLSFNEVCKQNNIYNANREYLLGRISSESGTSSSQSPVKHFEKVYDLLSNESLVELTWKALFALAETYTERGNFNKAKKFVIYARDLINLVAENIETTHFKTAYLQKEERRDAMEKLDKLQVA